MIHINTRKFSTVLQNWFKNTSWRNKLICFSRFEKSEVGMGTLSLPCDHMPISQKRGFLCDAPYKQHSVDPRELPKWGSWNPCCSQRNTYSGTWLILLLASERLLEGIFIWQKKQVPVASSGTHWRAPDKQESSQPECVLPSFKPMIKREWKSR